MSFLDILRRVADGETLGARDMEAALSHIFEGEVPEEQAAAFLTGLRVRGETTEELLSAIRFLKLRAVNISSPEGAVDCCGTGGDGISTVNISTAVAIVAAGAGVTLAKHGSRAVTSKSGSSEVLSQLGVDLTETIETQEKRLAEDGLAFLFAPNHHPILAKVAPLRKVLGLRTMFNILGPMMNPAGARRQLLGVFDAALAPRFAEVLRAEGSKHAWVVHGAGGMDELSLAGGNEVTELKDNEVRSFVVTPEDAGLKRRANEDLVGDTPEENAKALRAVLEGEEGAYRDAVLFNTAASLIVAGKTDDLTEGAKLAAEAIDSGAAKEKLRLLTTEKA
ncbi:anthranilate phosphoribosyltransferase [Parvularcula sp. ZS-1/3]|uniref:Anthranilate phosphoribosyltransferase n=1 Tax=Parvularcula mediterranea TaxID=2732508 RepID=A0A7Y3RQ79_9PROT|nr:anthranilate phosphoribosyltransferase [Parvularcula mediterranea]NNU17726.1 anthranilate phosphoribosyltransferase [Parvularcula mediterranea]